MTDSFDGNRGSDADGLEPMDVPLAPLLDDDLGEGASVAALEKVMARHRRRQTRLVAGGVVLALVAGAGAGWLVGQRSSSGGERISTASSPPRPTAVASASVGAVSAQPVPGAGGAFQVQRAKLAFARTTPDGIRIRGYDQPTVVLPTNTPSTAPPPPCGPTTLYQVGLSTDDSVGEFAGPRFDDPADLASPLTVVGAIVTAANQNTPMAAAIVKTGKDVATVVAHFPDGGVDQMAPVSGWAAVAHRATLPAAGSTANPFRPQGVVEALDANGKTLASVDLGAWSNQPMPLKPSSCSAVPAPAGPPPKLVPSSPPPAPVPSTPPSTTR